MSDNREGFGSRLGFILVAAGCAIGLGNVWRFPFITGQYGGAAFILIYLLFLLIFGFPILVMEFTVGRASQRGVGKAFNILEKPGHKWHYAGVPMIVGNYLLMMFYTTVTGWMLYYFYRMVTMGDLMGMSPEQVGSAFGEMLGNGPLLCFWMIVATFLGLSIVALGVKRGVEGVTKIMMVALLFIMLLLVVRVLTLPGAGEGVRYLIRPDFSKLTASAVAAAVGQGFFSLSLGMGIVITYSSYVKPSENLVASGTGTAIADLLFALLAGFAVMPAVFAAGIEPAAGPGLVFETLPYIFAKMGVDLPFLSAVAAFLFFAALLIAALTSSISLTEVCVAYLVEERGLKRGWACLLTFLVTWLLGLCCVFGPGVLDFLDSFSSNVLMTLGGLLCVVFVGWIMPRQDVQDELTNGGTVNRRTFRLLYFLMRYLAPLAVLSIFLSNLVW